MTTKACRVERGMRNAEVRPAFRRLTSSLAAVVLTVSGLSAQTAGRTGADSTSAFRNPRTAVYAIRNATIVPVVGARIANGTVVVSGGAIAAVGANVPVPAGAQVIDGSGLFVYPGLIDSGSQLGLTEIGSVPGSEDTEEIGEFNPHNVALTAVNPHSELIPVTRVNGVTTAIASATGGLVNGAASLFDLAGWTPAEMAVRWQAGIVMTYPALAGGGRGGFAFGPPRPESERREEMSRRVRQLRSYLADAKAYAELHGRLGAQGSPEARGARDGAGASAAASRANLAMEALIPVVRGEMPVVFDVQTADQIRGVLALADSFGLKVVLRGAREAWRLADTLAARKIPVIVGPLTSVPEMDDPYDMVYANPGVLARAGVTIAFQSADAANARDLPYHAALATAYGLDPEEALRAITINAARIWGVADRYGSIEPGKVANLVVTTGDPLDVRSVVRHVFIRGEPIPMTDRHTRLYEEFKARPKP